MKKITINKETIQAIKPDTLVRTAVLVLALINQILEVFGKSPLAVEDETVSQLINAAFTVVAAVAAYWKNNSVSAEAIEADEYLAALRSGEATRGEM